MEDTSRAQSSLPGLVHGRVDLLGPTVVPEQIKPGLSTTDALGI